MTTDLSDYTDWLRRSVGTPGNFDALFPNTSDDDLIGVLEDSLGEAQMDGFLISPTLYETLDGTVTPSLTRPQLALLMMYASVRFMRADLLNRKNRVHYEAGGAVYETEQAASIITELLKEATARKKEILLLQQNGAGGTIFYMADAYLAKAVGFQPLLPDMAYDSSVMLLG